MSVCMCRLFKQHFFIFLKDTQALASYPPSLLYFFFFFLNDPPPTETSPLPLHAPLPIYLHARGLKTAAFVAAFPLDHQFGLDRGFDVYSDRLGRDPDGRLANERPASQVVAEASAWLSANAGQPFFLWVHLFEPHAPYAGDPSRPAIDRYDDEIAAVDRAIARLLQTSPAAANVTSIVIAGDHGEAFGEHGEYAHSIFVYDTTLRVPLIIVPAARTSSDGGVVSAVVRSPVTLADVAPTVMHLVGGTMSDVDGIDLSSAINGSVLPNRELYAESFA